MWNSNQASSFTENRILNLEQDIRNLEVALQDIKDRTARNANSDNSALINNAYSNFNNIKELFDATKARSDSKYEQRFVNMEKQINNIKSDINNALETQEKVQKEMQKKLRNLDMQARNLESEIDSNRIRDEKYGGANVPLPRSRRRQM